VKIEVYKLKISISLDKNGQLQVNENYGAKLSKRLKGQSLLNVPSNYTMIDLETTGFNPSFDSIIEVACIKFRNGSEIDRFQSLIQPDERYDDNTFIDDFITSLTGITNEMLETAPKFDSICTSLWEFLQDELIVGHNVNFDVNFLYDNFQNCNNNIVFNNDFVDTLRLARRTLPELNHHRLDDLTDYFQIDLPHHRALNDCLMTQDVLLNMSKIITDKGIDLSSSHKRSKHQHVDLKNLQCTNSVVFEDHIFYDKNCVFTGVLESLPRKDAAQLVVNIGGHCENNVTTHTNFLIIGSQHSPLIKDGKSSKMKKAEKLILDGQDLKIISENTFYDLIADFMK